MRWDKDKDVRRWSGGAWLRLDPTPAARDAAAGNSPMRKIEQGLDWIDSLWSDYVMDMDRRRQEETIYQPAIRAIKQTASDVCDLRAGRRGLLQKIGNLLNVSQWNGIGGWLLHVGGPLLIVLGIMFLAFRRVWRAGRRLWRRMAARAVSRARRERSRVEFYHRFRDALGPEGAGPRGRPDAARVCQDRRRENCHYFRPARACLAARNGSRGLLPRSFRRPAPRQPPDRSGRTWTGGIAAF